LSDVDKAFFLYFEPKLFETEIFLSKEYDDCDKVSVYLLNKVLRGRVNKKDYVIDSFMGRGSHSYVMSVISLVTDKEYVLKLIPIKKKEFDELEIGKFKIYTTEEERIRREFQVQRLLHEEFKDDDKISIPEVVSEVKMKNGLYGVLMEKINDKEYKSFPKTFKKVHGGENWADDSKTNIKQIVFAVNQLHKKGFVHGDVAYRNMMYNEGRIIFLDFGRAVDVRHLDIFNRFLLQLYDYYLILNEIFRDNVNKEGEYKYLSDVLQRALTLYIKSEFDTKMLNSDDERKVFRKYRETLMETFNDNKTPSDEVYAKKKKV